VKKRQKKKTGGGRTGQLRDRSEIWDRGGRREKQRRGNAGEGTKPLLRTGEKTHPKEKRRSSAGRVADDQEENGNWWVEGKKRGDLKKRELNKLENIISGFRAGGENEGRKGGG